MKKVLLIIISIVFVLGHSQNMNVLAYEKKSDNLDDFRAVWVSTVLNLDFPSEKGISNEQMKEEINELVEQSKQMGLNAVILQVRPSGDALYKSDIFPWSMYLTGTQGVAPADSFDPLEYWIEACHDEGLELHAWINPYRVTHPHLKLTDVNKLSEDNPARQNPSWVVTYEDALYYDPALPETKKLVIDGIAEIVNNYDVDGIHLDDYFYPSPAFKDNNSYATYGNGQNKDGWRRDNVNELIIGIQKTLKEIDPNVRFGVSPFGIWQNASSDPLGSDTKGLEAYKSIYSDTRRWVKEEWIDYICPQIYWHIGFDIADYKKLLDWWGDVCQDTNVDLYIGHAAYREYENHSGWKGEIIRQLQLNETKDEVKGSIFFRAKSLVGNVGNQITEYYNEKDINKDNSDENEDENNDNNDPNENNENNDSDGNEDKDDETNGSDGGNKSILDKSNHIAYISGYSDGTIKPENNITRAEVSSIFYQLVSEENKLGYEKGTNKFDDVKSDQWYSESVEYLVEVGIISGYSDGSFKPNNEITRAEFVTMASKFEDLNLVDKMNFPDVLTEHWAYTFINSAYNNGWLSGYPDGTFKPDNKIIRAEAITVVNKILNRTLDQDIASSPFTDLFEDRWYYKDVLAASTKK